MGEFYSDIAPSIDTRVLIENRPQLQRMLKDAAAGKFNILFVWNPLTLSTNLPELAKLLKELENVGVTVADQEGMVTNAPTEELNQY